MIPFATTFFADPFADEIPWERTKRIIYCKTFEGTEQKIQWKNSGEISEKKNAGAISKENSGGVFERFSGEFSEKNVEKLLRNL